MKIEEGVKIAIETRDAEIARLKAEVERLREATQDAYDYLDGVYDAQEIRQRLRAARTPAPAQSHSPVVQTVICTWPSCGHTAKDKCKATENVAMAPRCRWRSSQGGEQ